MAERTTGGPPQDCADDGVRPELEHQGLFNAIFERAGIGIALCNRDGFVVDANPALAQMLGYSVSDLCTRHYREITHPDDLLLDQHQTEQLLRGETSSYRIEKRYLRKDGQTMWGELTVTTIPGPPPGHVIGMVLDISERKRAEEALHHKTKELKAAQRLARIGSALRDLQSDTMVWSDELYRIFGRDPQLPPPSWTELQTFFTPDSANRLAAAKEALFRENRDFELELELVGDGGPTRWIVYRAEIDFDAAGKPARYRTTIQDITERWMANLALRASEEKYRGIVETMTEGIWILDQDDRTVFVNEQMAAMLGYRVKEMLGRNLLEFKDEEARPVASRKLQRRRQGITEQYDATIQKKDGRNLRVLINTRPLNDANGHYLGSLGIITDITERMQLEERLRQTDKMEAIGRLAGGVAHDFNNLLTVINGYSELLQRKAGTDERVQEYLAEIRTAGQNAQELTSRLLSFSRHQIRSAEPLNLRELIEDTEKMLRRLISADVEFRMVFDRELGQVRADRIELTQILLNLAVNARDAMPAGGTLTFEARNMDVDAKYTRTHPGTQPGAYVLLSVTDTGIGMDANTKRHLFEPFFTTKPVGQGTGLGLATVYGIVTQCGGFIQVESETSAGTTFRIYLPRVGDCVPLQSDAVEVKPQPLTGTETILVVEDQPQVAEVICSILRAFGYDVLKASNGDEALKLAETHGGTVDLLLTDVMMPGMDGLELATRMRDIRPTPILFMSGYAGSMKAGHVSGVAYIQKPFSPEALARKVREVLAEGERSNPQKDAPTISFSE